ADKVRLVHALELNLFRARRCAFDRNRELSSGLTRVVDACSAHRNAGHEEKRLNRTGTEQDLVRVVPAIGASTTPEKAQLKSGVFRLDKKHSDRFGVENIDCGVAIDFTRNAQWPRRCVV